MRFFLVPFIMIVLVSCSPQKNEDVVKPANDSLINVISNPIDSVVQDAALSYSFEVFETPGLGWGYKIFDNGNLFINQPHIPAISGNKGFSTKEKAEVTASFAILKMEQGFVPPTLSPEELDSLGVLN